MKDPLLTYRPYTVPGFYTRVRASWEMVLRALQNPTEHTRQSVLSGEPLLSFTGATLHHVGVGYYAVRSPFDGPDEACDGDKNADIEFAIIAVLSGKRLWAPTPAQPHAKFWTVFKPMRDSFYPEVAKREAREAALYATCPSSALFGLPPAPIQPELSLEKLTRSLEDTLASIQEARRLRLEAIERRGLRVKEIRKNLSNAGYPTRQSRLI